MKNALEALPWVENADVDFANKTATVSTTEGEHDPAELCSALGDAGYGCDVVG